MGFRHCDTDPKAHGVGQRCRRVHYFASAELFGALQIYASVTNPFKAIGLLRRYTKAKKLPNKQSLDQVLSVELNAEFERLRAEYAPRNSSIRKLRPSFAAEKLMQEATDAVGLEDDAERIERKLAKLVKRHDVPVTRIGY